MNSVEILKQLLDGLKLTREFLKFSGYYTIENNNLWFVKVNEDSEKKIKNDLKQIFCDDWMPYKEQAFKENEWVTITNGDRAGRSFKIRYFLQENFVESYLGDILNTNSIKKASQEEIDLEKEMRNWEKINRPLNQFEIEDIVKIKGDDNIYVVEKLRPHDHRFFVNSKWKLGEDLEMVCPYDIRLDNKYVK